MLATSFWLSTIFSFSFNVIETVNFVYSSPEFHIVSNVFHNKIAVIIPFGFSQKTDTIITLLCKCLTTWQLDYLTTNLCFKNLLRNSVFFITISEISWLINGLWFPPNSFPFTWPPLFLCSVFNFAIFHFYLLSLIILLIL